MIDQKILSYVLMGITILLILAIVFVAVIGPYGSRECSTPYNLAVIQALLIPFTGVIGALLRGKPEKKD
jgi:high-affinity K+ transport system ATPase subunit B